jgi:hypothetical protein
MIPGDESELIDSFYSESELTRPVRHQVQGEQMRQAKLTFNAAIAMGVLGTLVLLSGIVVSFFDIRRGVSPTAAGIVMDVLSFFAIKFHRETNQRLDEIRRDENAIALVARIQDLRRRDEAICNLVKGLRMVQPRIHTRPRAEAQNVKQQS